jgi:peptidoglycan/xylan/chitin deacetylase (PgdA/CDA1 family)
MSVTGRAAAAAAVALAVQVGPAATWIDPVRRRLTPGLAGLGERGHLALTFDDGPHPEATPLTLAELDRLGWRATFFVLGVQARRRLDLVRAAADAGHEIGIHGDEHRYAIARSPNSVRADLERATDSVATATGRRPVWFRPPYGVLSGPVLLACRRLGLRPVLWSAWGRDWRAAATPASVLAELRRGVLDGGTALLHDSDVTSASGAWRSALGALPGLAGDVRDRGLRVGPLGEHIAADGSAGQR